MRSIVICIALLACTAVSSAAQDGRWQAHTSFRQITDISASEAAVWAATTGGVFRVLAGSGEMSSFTASDGLHSVQTHAIAYDPVRDVVWIGYLDGVLDRLDPASGTIRTYRDIERAQRFSSREINEIVVRGDSVFVATSFGVVVFDPVRGEVRDTYSQLGSLTSATPVYDIAFAPGPDGDEAFWLATKEGVAYAPKASVNLQDPSVWTAETDGLPGLETRSIAYFDGKLYAGTVTDLAVREGANSWSRLQATGTGIFDLLALEDRLVATGRFDLYVLEADRSAGRIEISGYQDPVAAAAGPDGRIWVGDRQGGLVVVEPPSSSDARAQIVMAEVYPSGPYDNLFEGLQVDAEGNLWAAGVAGPNRGFYKYSPSSGWTNYIRRFVPGLEGANTFERIHVDARGHAWAGSSGNALAEVTADGTVRIWDDENSTIRPAAGTESFIIIGGIASDAEGRIWVTNRASPVPLHVYDPEEGWTGIPRLECDGFTTTGLTLDEIFIDSFGQKWIIVLDLANLRRVVGLLVLDTAGTPGETGDDACNFFAAEGSGGQGLPGTTVTSVAEDRDGLIWIGTQRGLAFMINGGVVARDDAAVPIWPQHADRTQGTFLLNGIHVMDLAVDPANRIWVATDQGVSVVQQVEGGYEVAELFTSENSPLFSDVVVAIAVDPHSGRVYMATDQGLVSYESDAVAASEQPRDLKVYPNPVRLADGAEPSIFIEGLVEATELRVVTLAGEVVARMQTRGGRARWDGRGLDDRLVPSGMYLVVAVGENGEGSAYGRVAIIR